MRDVESDKFPPEVRALVYEYDLEIVNTGIGIIGLDLKNLDAANFARLKRFCELARGAEQRKLERDCASK